MPHRGAAGWFWVGNDLGPITLAETDEDVVRAFTAMTSRLHAAGYADSIRVVTFETHATDAETLDGVWAVING